MKHRFSFLLIFFVYCISSGIALAAPPVSSAGGGATQSYQDARRYYQELKISDPNVTQLMEWEKAASEMLRFLNNHPNDKDTPVVLYNLGKLYERTYQARQFRTGLTRAVYFYEQLAKKFPGNSLGDDALLALGDLRRNALQDEAAARAAYYEIIDRYSRGDMVQAAKSRVEGSGAEDTRTAAIPKPEKSGSPKTVPTVTPSRAVKPAIEKPVETIEEEKSAGEGLLGGIFTGGRAGGKEIFKRDGEERRPLIVIDPGHGGEDQGAVGVGKIEEKEVVLNIALFLDELLRDRLRARTVLTRGRDIFIPLPDRTEMANKNEADLFISVHTNASPFKSARGIETYYLDNTRDKASLKLAERENASLAFSGHKAGDVGFIISDLIQNAKLDDSISLAHNIQNAMIQTVSRYYQGVKDLGVKKAPFFVLVGAHMPCVLVEVSFIDHPEEGRRLTDRHYQKLIAEALYRGVRDFFEKRNS